MQIKMHLEKLNLTTSSTHVLPTGMFSIKPQASPTSL